MSPSVTKVVLSPTFQLWLQFVRGLVARIQSEVLSSSWNHRLSSCLLVWGKEDRGVYALVLLNLLLLLMLLVVQIADSAGLIGVSYRVQIACCVCAAAAEAKCQAKEIHNVTQFVRAE
jgi:hypothetical protein